MEKIKQDDQDNIDTVKEMLATADIGVTFMYQDITSGPVSIPLEMKKFQKILFWVGTPQEMKGKKLVCGGMEHNLSDPAGNFFDSCTASSTVKEPFACESGFAGKMKDMEFQMWKADEDAPTVWTILKLNKTILPSRIEFAQPESQDEMISKLTVY